MASLGRSTRTLISKRSDNGRKSEPQATRREKQAFESSNSNEPTNVIASDDEFQPIIIPKRLLLRKKIKPKQGSITPNHTQSPSRTSSLPQLPESKSPIYPDIVHNDTVQMDNDSHDYHSDKSDQFMESIIQQNGFFGNDYEDPEPFTQRPEHYQSPIFDNYSDLGSIGSEPHQPLVDNAWSSHDITTAQEPAYSQAFDEFSDDETFPPLKESRIPKLDNELSEDETIDLTIKQEVLSTQETSIEIENVTEWLKMGSVTGNSPRLGFTDDESNYSIRSWAEENNESARDPGDTGSFELQDNEYDEEGYRLKDKDTECPICFLVFPGDLIQEHAAECRGSSDPTRSLVNQEPCPLCGVLVDKDKLQDHVEAELSNETMSVQGHDHDHDTHAFIGDELVGIQDYSPQEPLSPLLGFTNLLKYRSTRPDCAKYFDQFEPRPKGSISSAALIEPSQEYNEILQGTSRDNSMRMNPIARFARPMAVNQGRQGSLSPLLGFTNLLDNRFSHPDCAKYFEQFDIPVARSRSSSTTPTRGQRAPRGRPKKQGRQRRGSRKRE
ncbi:hypothetical protein CLU79DRAFT_778270 [Phycomyces nitens]|nr:hypothetical protein CLU79DRAFT_778270 [Phycomyces nitens]